MSSTALRPLPIQLEDHVRSAGQRKSVYTLLMLLMIVSILEKSIALYKNQALQIIIDTIT